MSYTTYPSCSFPSACFELCLSIFVFVMKQSRQERSPFGHVFLDFPVEFADSECDDGYLSVFFHRSSLASRMLSLVSWMMASDLTV